MNKIDIYLVPLGISIGIYWFLLRKKESAWMKALKEFPYLVEKKNEIIRDSGIELLKITGLYLVINTALKK